jgi:hypothetical protein
MCVGLRKPDPRSAQPVNIGGIEIAGSIATGIKRSLVICIDDDDIWFLLVSTLTA